MTMPPASSREHKGDQARSSCTSPTRRPTGRCTRLPEDIAKYKGKLRQAGWEVMRRKHATSANWKMGLIDPKKWKIVAAR